MQPFFLYVVYLPTSKGELSDASMPLRKAALQAMRSSVISSQDSVKILLQSTVLKQFILFRATDKRWAHGKATPKNVG
jgi:hypothetical protein